MMKYTVLSEFADLQDNNHIYEVGSEYPREGYSPSDKRIEELSTAKNKQHKPLIQKVEKPELEMEQEPDIEPEIESEAEPDEKPEAVKKTKRAKKNED